MKNLTVNNKYNEKKLNKFLLDNIPGLTFGMFSNLLRKKDIKINGKRINKDILVYTGDEVIVYITDDFLESKSSINLDIVYEDENILVINKPSNLEVTGTNSLTDLVHKKYTNSDFKPMPCHRIDRNTTGLVLFAKNELSLDILLNKFKKHEIEKHYLAMVYGIPSVNYKRDIAYLFKDNKKSLVYISNSPKKRYVKIITSFTVLEKRKDNTSILDVQIETGKTHQIRAHLAYLGFPIIGDGKYGKNEINKKFGKKTQMLCNYFLKFNFNTDSNLLNYLNNKIISLDTKKLLK
ncbi:MAG: RluA family pseudouridine synthase [Clostridia bacterium]